MATFLTSRQFNQDTSGAKRAAADGPVYIADRGRQAHVLLTIEEYEKLLDGKTSLLEAIAQTQDGDFDFKVPRLTGPLSRAVDFT